jgi:hypothetical protein
MSLVSKNQIKGYLCVVMAAILWSSWGTEAKDLFEEGMTTFDLVQIRATLSAVILTEALGIF